MTEGKAQIRQEGMADVREGVPGRMGERTIFGNADVTKDDVRDVQRQPRHDAMPSSNGDTTATDGNAKDEASGLGLSMPSVIGTALAAVTATALSTKIGIAGSLIGTVVARR